jgi:hypothetical protein
LFLDLVSLQSFRKALELQEDQLELTQQQIVLFENWLNKKNNKKLPTIYAVTPTYWRFVQKAELTRISQTLRLVPNVHWIVVEDSETKTELVRNLIVESGLVATHLNAKTPPFEQLQSKESQNLACVTGHDKILCRNLGGSATGEWNKETQL